jgi:tetratricopeptide (TPR) repeat protein
MTLLQMMGFCRIMCLVFLSVLAHQTLYAQSSQPVERADSVMKLGFYQEAISLYMDIYDSLTFHDQSQSAALILSNIGLSYLYLNDSKNAYKYLQKSLKDAVPSDTVTYVEILRKNGVYYDYSGMPDSALLFLGIAFNLAQPKSAYLTSKVLRSIGDVHYYNYSDYLNAENYYLSALRSSEKVVDDAFFMAGLYYVLASMSRIKGDAEKAQIFALKALSLYHDSDLMNRANCYSLIANSYYVAYEYAESVRYNWMAIELVREKEELRSFIGKYYNNLADSYLHIGQLDSSEYCVKKSMEYVKRYNLNQADLSISFQLLGLIRMKQKNYKEAELYLNNSKELKTRIYGQNHSETAKVHNFLGHLYLNQDLFRKSIIYFQKGIECLLKDTARIGDFNNPDVYKINDYQTYFSILSKKGEALKRLYELSADTSFLNAGLNTYVRLDEVLQHSKLKIEQESSLINYANEFKHCYENAISLAYQKYLIHSTDSIINLSLNFIESLKSLVLWQSINKMNLQNKLNIPDSVYLAASLLDKQIAYNRSKLARLTDSKEQDLMKIVLADLHSKKEALNLSLKEDYPEFYNLKYDMSPVNVKEFFNIHEDMGILSYFFGDNELFGIYINKSTSAFYKVPIQEVIVSLENLKNLIFQNKDIGSMAKYVEFCDNAYFLFQKLFHCDISLTKNLLIIPDGPLSYLPYDVLITNNNFPEQVNYRDLAYLIRQLNIHYAVSLRTYSLEIKTTRHKHSVIGFSYMDDPDSKYFLGGGQNEISEISRIVRGDFFTNTSSSKQYFMDKAGNADVIHLALHGIADTVYPLESKLVFSNLRSADENAVYAYDLYGLKLNARLTVLNACETGSGKYETGEGVISLAKGFIYAGSKCVKTHLYKIDDRSIKDITINFYRLLDEGIHVGAALRKAKMDYIKQSDELSAHPYYWASSILIGNNNFVLNLDRPPSDLKIFITIVLILLFVLFLIYVIKRVKLKFRYL